MAKKAKQAEHENLERWLVSYADFITLLFATFVVLYALAQVDLAKFKEFSQAVQQAFNPSKSIMEEPGGVLKGTPKAQLLESSGNSILDKVMPRPSDNSLNPPQAMMTGSIKSVTEAVQQINRDINIMNIEQGIKHKEAIDKTELKLQERGIVISFSSSLFFEPGQAGLKPSAFSVLDKVAKTLKDSGRVIHVEGHTDSAPISTAVYPSNWELSSARSSSVIRYFIQKHSFNPQTLAAIGYADTRPVASNKIEEGRRKNRRVDVVILFSNALNQADARAAQKTEKVLISSSSEGIGNPEENMVEAVKPIQNEDKGTPQQEYATKETKTKTSGQSVEEKSEENKKEDKKQEEKKKKREDLGFKFIEIKKPDKPNIFKNSKVFDKRKNSESDEGKSETLKKLKFFQH